MQYIYDIYQFITGAYPVICARCHYDNYLETDCKNGPRDCSICNRSTSFVSNKAFTNEQIKKIRNNVALEYMLNPNSVPILCNNEEDEDTELVQCSHCKYNLIMRHIMHDNSAQMRATRDMTEVTICSDCVMRDPTLVRSLYKPESMTLYCGLCDIPILASYNFHSVCLAAYRKKISGEKKKQ